VIGLIDAQGQFQLFRLALELPRNWSKKGPSSTLTCELRIPDIPLAVPADHFSPESAAGLSKFCDYPADAARGSYKPVKSARARQKFGDLKSARIAVNDAAYV